MDLSDKIALVYAEDLMKFVMRQRKIHWWESSLGSDAFEDEAKGHFPFVMGVVVVGLAKSLIKESIRKTRKKVLRKYRHLRFVSYIKKYVKKFFKKNERSPMNIIRVMAYIVEASVLLYMNRVEYAPLQGIKIISRFIQDEVPNRADMLDKLKCLRKWAIIVKKDPNHRIAVSFMSGSFYGDA